MKRMLVISLMVMVSSCNQGADQAEKNGQPATTGEANSGYSYIPLDPLPVSIVPTAGCAAPRQNTVELLNALPDNAVRVSIRQMDAKGTVTLGPAAVGSEGSQYQVILDYINADTANIRFSIGQVDRSKNPNGYIGPLTKITPDTELWVERLDLATAEQSPVPSSNEVVIPVYVGVGLRLTATVQILKGSVNLASLGAIAASVEAQKAAGSLVVQTLGINGKQVAASLPLPSELNSTTIQNAIQSLGSIKAVMYDAENTRVTPRVTGIYSPLQFNSPRLINSIVSQLAKARIPWSPACIAAGSASGPPAATPPAAKAESPGPRRTAGPSRGRHLS